MRTMYDSTNWAAIPADAAMVAGYVDGRYKWPDDGWERFPSAVKVRIAVFAATDDGHVLDVERGNAAPEEAPGWVKMRRAAGVDPSVYCNLSTWPAVRRAFAAAGVSEPHYWVAEWGRHMVIPDGAVALQYRAAGLYDLSVVADHWPGVDLAVTITSASTVDINMPGHLEAVKLVQAVEAALTEFKNFWGI